MPTVVCKMLWVSAEPYDKKMERLHKCITEQSRENREVVLVGVSAGGPLAIIGLKESGDVLAAVSISGLLAPSPKERRNKPLMATSWFEAAAEAEKVIPNLTSEQKRRILTISGQKDDVITPKREHIKGVAERRYRGWSHLPTVVRVMLVHPGRIKQFVRRVAQSH